jgi:hypothetical protein
MAIYLAMNNFRNKSKLTQSVHAGSFGDPQFKGTVTPIFPSSAYDYEGVTGGTIQYSKQQSPG